MLSHDKEMSWSEAEWFCKWTQSQLAVVKDKKSQDQLMNLLSLKGIKRNYWVGGYSTPDSQWRWIDDTEKDLGNDTQVVINEYKTALLVGSIL